jgi:hypothetical protein
MLEPDGDQIEIFVDAIFRHASPQGFVTVRSFLEGRDQVFRITPATVTPDRKFPLDICEDDARRAAQNPAAIVFAPPLTIFNNTVHAREGDLLEGLALSVECDEHPQQARQTLEVLLGPATVVVRSGGRWINGGAQPEDKLHLHWRLNRPASGEAALAALKQARNLAARLVGGDPSNKPVCHPIRWPGSWHRKAEPRMCSIESIDPDVEIVLDDALAKLKAAAPGPEANPDDGTGTASDGADWYALVNGIITGTRYHASLVSLAARLVGAGLYDGQTVKLLRALMSASTGPHDAQRWQVRYDEVPRIVSSARAKYAADNSSSPAGLTIFSGAEETLPPPRGWLLGNSFCRRLTSSLLASGGTGKTALRILQAVALATGRPLTAEHIFRRTKVLFVLLEDDADELRRRVLAARLHHSIPAADLADWLFLSAPDGSAGKLMTANHKAGVITVGALAGSIEAAIVAYGIGLVILDPLVKTHGLTENSNDEMDALAGLLSTLAARHDVAIDLPHYVGKGPADPGNADRGRGASSTVSACRLVFTLATMTTEEAQRFSIPEEDRRGYVRLDRAKVNPARSGGPATWFRLVSVAIGNPSEIYPAGDEVQTVECWTPPETWGGLDAVLLNRILTAIDEGAGGGNFYTHSGPATDRAAWEVVCRLAPQKSEAQAREVISAWIKSGLLIKFDYVSPTTRKSVKGLKVDDEKRPT